MSRLKALHRLVVTVGSASLLVALLVIQYVEGWSVFSGLRQPLFTHPEPASSLKSPLQIFAGTKPLPHVIDTLISQSREEAQLLLSKRTYDFPAAVEAYRQRRGREPPAGFDKWVEFALKHDCLVIEDFFDQVYHDIEPFWGLDAMEIRSLAEQIPIQIRVRNGKAERSAGDWHFLKFYYDMVQKIEQYLPDVVLPVNEMDEPRVLVPWEDIDRLYRSKIGGSDPLTSAQGRKNIEWIHEGSFWDLARAGCPPNLPGRHVSLDTDFSTAPQFPTTWPAHTVQGFHSNWTKAKDPCIHDYLRNLHGTYVEPISQSISTKLIPMFSGSKLAVNNDILIPGAVYWKGDEHFVSSKPLIEWEEKRNEVLWRGSASGGRNKANNWTRFQRHRLLSMLNGTQVAMTLDASNMATSMGDSLPFNFPLPDQKLYPLKSVAAGVLPDWIRSLSNAAFTWLVCFPATEKFGCSYTGAWYRQGNEIPLHEMFQAKYLPDVDGNSFSGRFLAFLKSNSLPIKATIYSEWHDSRLIPWRHFVPMDNTFVDMWALLEYFIHHDDAAKEIALEGRKWANMVLRRDDMLAYVFRLILEYARVCDTGSRGIS